MKAALAMLVPVMALFSPAAAAPLTGQEVLRLITQAMTHAGQPAPDMPAPLRALPDCAHPPKVAPVAGNWRTVSLDCDAPVAWRRMFRTGADVAWASPAAGDEEGGARPPALTVPALLAVRPLQRGGRITPGDLRQAQLPAAGHGGQTLSDPADAEGRRLRVPLRAGQPLLERHLEPALDIEPGQEVSINLQGAGIEISAAGTALGGGVIGDLIRVRQGGRDGRDVEALIVARGIVRVRPNMRRRSVVRQGIRRLQWSTQSHRM
nr:flagellar basal body P-ring formation chaperone FlgA [Paracoccus saliphilus]